MTSAQRGGEPSATTSIPPYRILSLDGGGAKGFYTLGVLREIEGMMGRPLHTCFDLIFGTSTGSVIAALLALGHSVDDIHTLYKSHVPTIMQKKLPSEKSQALADLGREVFGDAKFDTMKTGIGIVATRWLQETPMIFKASADQAHGRHGTFAPGFGCTVSDAVQASCSAFPFFNRKIVTTAAGDHIELVDGGYCANNPTLYAIADATRALNKSYSDLRVVSIGVGVYPAPKKTLIDRLKLRIAGRMLNLDVDFVQKILEFNTQSMDQLRRILFANTETVRISQIFDKPEMATDLFEHDLKKLNVLRQRGSESFAEFEPKLKTMLM